MDKDFNYPVHAPLSAHASSEAIKRLSCLNAELLEALSAMLLVYGQPRSIACKKARAAIKKATDDFDYWSNM